MQIYSDITEWKNRITICFLFVLFISLFLYAGRVFADYKQYTIDDLDKVYDSVSEDGDFMFFYGKEEGLNSDHALFTLSYKDQICSNLLFPSREEKNIRSYEDRMNDLEIIKQKYAKPCIDKLNKHLKNVWEEWDADRSIRDLKRGEDFTNGGKFKEDDIPSKSHLYNDCFLGEEKTIQGKAFAIDNEHVKITHSNYRNDIIKEPFSFIVNKYDINFLLDELNEFYGDQYYHYIDLVKKHGLKEIPVKYSDGTYIYNISLDELDSIDKIKGIKDENCIFTITLIEYPSTEFYPGGHASQYWTIGSDTLKEIAEGVKPVYYWHVIIGIFILIPVVIVYKKRKKVR